MFKVKIILRNNERIYFMADHVSIDDNEVSIDYGNYEYVWNKTIPDIKSCVIDGELVVSNARCL